MDLFRISMNIISFVLVVYAMLIFVRIVLSWVSVNSESFIKARQFINQLTDPYLNIYRGIRWLHIGLWDFTPIFGTMVLYFVVYLTSSLAAGHFPTIYHMLIWVFVSLWGIVAFILVFLAAVMIIRLFTLYLLKGPTPAWIDQLDRFLFPLVSKFLGGFLKKPVPYPVALGILSFVLIALRVLIGFGVAALATYLKTLLAG